MEAINLRKKNLIWSIAEDYNLNIEYDDFIDSLNLYELINFSYLLSKDTNYQITDYLHYLYSLEKNNTFCKLFILAVNEYSYEKILKKRSSIHYHKLEYYNKLKTRFNKVSRKDIYDEIQYTLTEKYFNNTAKTTKNVKNLANTILKFSDLNNIESLINNFNELLNEYFHFSIPDFEDSSKKSKRKDVKNKKKKNGFGKIENLLDEYYGLIGSAEFTADLDLDNIKRDEDEKVLNIIKEDDTPSKKHLIAQNLFGKNKLNPVTKKALEDEICYGTHRNNQIIISDGDFFDNLEANFRKRQFEESYEENMDYINFFQNFFQRSKNSMIKELRNSLTKNLDSYMQKSKYGKLHASKIYRNLYINDTNIFNKKIPTQTNDIAIDILIDGSASQINRKTKIASWAYIITESLTALNLPTRVMTYSNLENYLGLTIYRNYNDNINMNKKILNFTPAGSNRDGLAFRLVNKLMNQSKYKQKILIYLTDGKPFDVRARINNDYKNDEREYKDKFAEIDTSIEFRKLEQNDIFPLAIFTGDEEDLIGMKKIYGNNFAYIKDIDRFASIIIKYIKQVIND